jgi:hypothetical protein
VRDILGYQLLFKNVIGGRSCPSVLSLLALLALLCGFAMAIDDNVPLPLQVGSSFLYCQTIIPTDSFTLPQ